MARPRSFLAPLIDNPSAPMRLVRAADGRPVATSVEAAFDSATRRKGLLGRDGLEAGTALIIAPSNAVHTFFMRFPIDVVFVSRAGVVLKVTADLAPWRIAVSARAFAVVEVAAGGAVSAGVRPGDQLALLPG